MKICNECATELPVEAKFCNKCGAKQELPKTQTVDKEVNEKETSTSNGMSDEMAEKADVEETSDNMTVIGSIGDNIVWAKAELVSAISDLTSNNNQTRAKARQRLAYLPKDIINKLKEQLKEQQK